VAGVTGADAHYFFPPASAYALNRLLFALKSDAAVRARYVAEPDATLRAHGLDDAAAAAVKGFDRDRLLALGAHPYLVFMAQVRLGMERAPETYEYF
jgi:aromatic-ring opening dioxygenase LigAB LigA subunit